MSRQSCPDTVRIACAVLLSALSNWAATASGNMLIDIRQDATNTIR